MLRLLELQLILVKGTQLSDYLSFSLSGLASFFFKSLEQILRGKILLVGGVIVGSEIVNW